MDFWVAQVVAFGAFPVVGLLALIGWRICNRPVRDSAGSQAKRPDYEAIARMEREVWGEAFMHAGAIEVRTLRARGEVAFVPCRADVGVPLYVQEKVKPIGYTGGGLIYTMPAPGYLEARLPALGEVGPALGMAVRIGTEKGPVGFALAAADASMPRVDLLFMGTDGRPAYIAGRADTHPVAPALPGPGYRACARIRVTPGMTEVRECNITQVAA